MRAETIRRLLVLGVCALGVTSLYLVPSIARSPGQLAAPDRTDDRPSSGPTTVVSPVSVTLPPQPTVTRTATADPESESSEQPPVTVTATTTQPPPTEPSTRRPSPPAGTPFTPGTQRDRTAPAAVTGLALRSATPASATLTWQATTDDVGVTAYKVWLNGYVVRTTTETTATVPWFNDDSAQQVVQVRAVDAAGNESETAPSLLADRPTPAPTPTATPTPSATEGASTPDAQAADQSVGRGEDPTPR